MEEMIFPMGSVPVSVAAKVYGKDACWVRAGIISGWLPIGKATRNGKEITNLDEMDSRRGRINFYISPKLLWEHTGYMWEASAYEYTDSSRDFAEEPLLDSEASLLRAQAFRYAISSMGSREERARFSSYADILCSREKRRY